MRDSGPSYPFYCMTTVFLTSLSFPVFMRCLEIVVHMSMKFDICCLIFHSNYWYVEVDVYDVFN